jgi:hypothetical protein
LNASRRPASTLYKYWSYVCNTVITFRV